MTGNGHGEELQHPTSARRSTRSRKPDQETTPTVVPPAKRSATSGRKRAQPTGGEEESPNAVKERASKRARVDKVENSTAAVKSPSKRASRGATSGVDSPLLQDSTTSSTGKRGRPRKTPVVPASPKDVTATTPSKRATARRKPIVPEPATDGKVDAATVKPSTSKRTRATAAAPIRHSSNPLDDEHGSEPNLAEPDDTVDLAELNGIEGPVPHGNAAFDLTSEQSREAFLRNERWQRDKDARNFNFEGDVNEGRKLRSGRGLVVVETEESDPGETEEEGTVADGDMGDDSLDEDERQKRAVSKTQEKDGEFEADNDYLSQLTYDTSMPVETQKSTLDVPTSILPDPTRDQSGSLALTPFARKVLRTVISNLAGCHTNTPPAPMKPEEEKNEALMQLVNLLKGTVERGEGNSCLILGAKGSGKTRVRHSRVLQL